MVKGDFLEFVTCDEAKRLIAQGRQAYEFKTKNAHKGPIFGPAYDDPGWLNRAKKANLYAETVEAAQQCARLEGTEIDGVVFLTEANRS